MTAYIITLLVASLYIWVVFACDTYLTTNTTLERSPILMASLLWPIAVSIAFVRIVAYFVFGKKE